MTFYVALVLASFIVALCALMLIRVVSERFGWSGKASLATSTRARRPDVRHRRAGHRGAQAQAVAKPWGW